MGQSDENGRKNRILCQSVDQQVKRRFEKSTDFIRKYVNAKGIILDEIVTDIGSGLDCKRKKWNELLDEVMNNQIETIYITYKDRFVLLGYDWFETLCRKHNTEIVVLNNVETSPDQEMVGDIASIVDIFSCRLPGLRKYKSKIANDKSLTDGENNEKDSEEPWKRFLSTYAITDAADRLYATPCTMPR